MSTCNCVTPCTTCVCANAPSEEVVHIYQILKEFISTNFLKIEDMVRDGLVQEEQTDGTVCYGITQDAVRTITTTFIPSSTTEIWEEPQQFLIPMVSRDIMLNILRELYIRAETSWSKIFPSHKLHMKVSIGDIMLGVLYPEIKAYPEMVFTSYEELFEGMDLTPNYKVYDRTPYGSMMNWFVNMDWTVFLHKSVLVAPVTGAENHEVPISHMVMGWMIYRCIRMSIEDLLITEQHVKIGDRYLFYSNNYIVSKILGKTSDDPTRALGFKKQRS